MSSVKITLLTSACLLATVSLANAGELKLSADQLDSVTAGAVPSVPSVGTVGDSATFNFFGAANPEPEPEPEPEPSTPSIPNVPFLPNLPGGGGGLQAFIQNLIGGFAFN
jgi:hypothetical protein